MFVRVKAILISAIEAGGIVKRFRYAEEVAGASSVEMWEWVTDRSRQVAPRESSPISVLISDAAHNRGRKHSASHAHAVAVSDVQENDDTPYNTSTTPQRTKQGTPH